MKVYGHKFYFCVSCQKETLHFLLTGEGQVFVCRHEYLQLQRLLEQRDLHLVETRKEAA
jgi:hypothetical protein